MADWPVNGGTCILLGATFLGAIPFGVIQVTGGVSTAAPNGVDSIFAMGSLPISARRLLRMSFPRQFLWNHRATGVASPSAVGCILLAGVRMVILVQAIGDVSATSCISSGSALACTTFGNAVACTTVGSAAACAAVGAAAACGTKVDTAAGRGSALHAVGSWGDSGNTDGPSDPAEHLPRGTKVDGAIDRGSALHAVGSRGALHAVGSWGSSGNIDGPSGPAEHLGPMAVAAAAKLRLTGPAQAVPTGVRAGNHPEAAGACDACQLWESGCQLKLWGNDELEGSGESHNSEGSGSARSSPGPAAERASPSPHAVACTTVAAAAAPAGAVDAVGGWGDSRDCWDGPTGGLDGSSTSHSSGGSGSVTLRMPGVTEMDEQVN